MSVNLLDLIPVKLLQHEETEDGLISVLKPKFKNKFVVKFIMPTLKSPNFKVKLDDFGSFVWKQIDGATTVEEIGNKLKENFSENVEPVYERLSVYIHTLVRYQFINFKNFDLKKNKLL